MRRHVIMFFSVFFCLLCCFPLFCNKSLDASADEPLQITKMSIADTRTFFGNTISARCRVTGSSAWTTTTFNYRYALTSFSPNSMNLAVNFFADSYSEFEGYDVIVYDGIVPTMEYNDLEIDLPIYFPDYGIGAFAISNRLDSWEWSGITQYGNVIESYPENRYDDFDAIAANQPSTVYGAFYLSVTGYGSNYWRLYPYQCDSDGTFFNTLHVQSARAYFSSGNYKLDLMIFCPHIGSTPEHNEPAITTTVTDNSAALPPITVNVDVDLGPVVSGLDGIAGQVAQAKEDVRGISTDISAIGSLLAVDEQQTQSVLYLDPIDTLPTLDYHKVIDDVDGVLEDIPAAVAGTASIWGIISAFFTSDSVWLWLVPLCIFLCLASFVLWRR